jgi:hypothetical protein
MSQNSLVLPTTGTVSGLTMTQDTNNALDTLNTCWSGGSAPSSPEDCQLWADTTNNLLKQWDATNSVWQIIGILRASSANFVHGGCRLSVASTTSLKLSQFNGSGLIINGIPCNIPSAGVTLSNSGLAASTLYYVYAYMSSGTMTLEAVTTTHVTGTNGVEQKSGDATRTLVGMVYMNASTQFVGGGTCLNWFNRRMIPINSSLFTPTTSSLSATNLFSAISFLLWGDSPAQISLAGTAYNNTAGDGTGLQINVDGTLSGVAGATTSSGVNASQTILSSAPVGTGGTDGYHTLTAYGNAAAGGTANFSIAFSGSILG